jgi:hypothetical protein
LIAVSTSRRTSGPSTPIRFVSFARSNVVTWWHTAGTTMIDIHPVVGLKPSCDMTITARRPVTRLPAGVTSEWQQSYFPSLLEFTPALAWLRLTTTAAATPGTYIFTVTAPSPATGSRAAITYTAKASLTIGQGRTVRTVDTTFNWNHGASHTISTPELFAQIVTVIHGR